MLYSELGYEAPFIASMILSGIDFVMRVVVIEGQNVGDETASINSEKTVKEEPPVKQPVTWLQLLKQKRLVVSLGLTVTVATVMSAFEVRILNLLLKPI